MVDTSLGGVTGSSTSASIAAPLGAGVDVEWYGILHLPAI